MKKMIILVVLSATVMQLSAINNLLSFFAYKKQRPFKIQPIMENYKLRKLLDNNKEKPELFKADTTISDLQQAEDLDKTGNKFLKLSRDLNNEDEKEKAFSQSQSYFYKAATHYLNAFAGAEKKQEKMNLLNEVSKAMENSKEFDTWLIENNKLHKLSICPERFKIYNEIRSARSSLEK